MRRFVAMLTLSTPKSRLAIFMLATVLVYVAPVSILAQLSIWKHLGIPAPSIGLTRAYHYLIHGEIAAAYNQNRLIFIVLMLGLPLLLKDLYNILNMKRKGAIHGQHHSTGN